ncbi:MAG TPA: twin-arginine translocase subunit TatC [Solirubrobacteraceae bacterium]|jgi:sec-independent protein translocase protein TatC
MATAIRTIGHEDRLSVVDHLEELRVRLIVSALALAVAFGLCLWQNHALLRLVNEPLEKQTSSQVAKGHGPLGQTALAQQGVLRLAHTTEGVLELLSAPKSGLSASARSALAGEVPNLKRDVASIPRTPEGNKPVTLGIGEPFVTTVTVTFIFALIFSAPVLLFELYGFVLPSFTPVERRAVRPLLISVPFLFAAGVLFGYFIVLPAAVRFFQNFNSSEFNVLVQASPYYKFAATILLAMGLVFQVPVAILGAVHAGLVTPTQLRKGRRYALVACATVAALLPGDAMTLILETVPLYVLYELSIVLAAVAQRRAAARRPADSGEDGGGSSPGAPPRDGPGGSPQPSGGDDCPGGDLSVQEIIDHVDRRLLG